MIHLTNDAIQNQSDDYGKFEVGNKISYSEIDKYISKKTDISRGFKEDIVEGMKFIATKTIEAVFGRICEGQQAQTFEIFGLDYMLDSKGNPYLIEFNTNPCLELSSTLLSRIIPQMLENALRIALDPIFPPPEITFWGNNRKIKINQENTLTNNLFEIIFDSLDRDRTQELKKYQQMQENIRQKYQKIISNE